jgi:hypothetical protein
MRLPSKSEIDQAAQVLLAEGEFQDDLEDKLNSSDAVLELAQHALRPAIENPEDISSEEEVIALLRVSTVIFFRLGVLAGLAMPRNGQE